MTHKIGVIIPAAAGLLTLSGCFYSHTTEAPPPAPPAAAVVATCVFAGQAYSVGARLTTPEAHTVECGGDGIWHRVM